MSRENVEGVGRRPAFDPHSRTKCGTAAGFGSVECRLDSKAVIATDEYELLTEDAGIVERPGRAVILLEGGEAAEFLQGQVTNDVEALEQGQGCYAALLDHKGKLRADMRVLRLGPDSLQVDGEAIAREVLRHNFETYSLGRDVRAQDLTDERTVTSVIGPAARERLGIDLPDEEHAFVEGELGLYVATDLGVDVIGTAPDLPGASEETAPNACASSPAARGLGWTWTTPRSRRRPGSTSAP